MNPYQEGGAGVGPNGAYHQNSRGPGIQGDSNWADDLGASPIFATEAAAD